MNSQRSLQRFIQAQERNYKIALAEVKNGKKQSHWMWYIFPQIEGLGYSENAQFYALHNLQEASEYLHHTMLGKRLMEISTALLNLETNDAFEVFGSPDHLKLHSSMTLFSKIPTTNPVFQKVLDKFFGGKNDPATLEIIKRGI